MKMIATASASTLKTLTVCRANVTQRREGCAPASNE
jgi:hypothetical protein